MHHEDVRNVYYGFRPDLYDDQPIELFHLNLSENLLTWIDDPLVGQRTRPTGIEMNQMLVNAMGFPSLLKDGDVRECHELYETKNQQLVELMTILEKDTDAQRITMTKQNSLELAILKKKVDKLRTQKPHVLNAGGMSNNHDTYMLFEYVNDLEDEQKMQFEAFNRTLVKAHDIPIATDLIDLSELRDILNEFPTALKKYAVELAVNRQQHWKNEENNQLVAMRANLSKYFVGAAGVSADTKAICQKAIDTAECTLQTVLKTDEKIQKIEEQIQKIQSDIVEIVNSMDQPMKTLGTVAQNHLNAKLIR